MKLSIHAPGTGSQIQVAKKFRLGKEVLVHPVADEVHPAAGTVGERAPTT